MATAWARAVLEIQTVDMRIRDMDVHLSLLPKERRRIADAKKALDGKIEARRSEIKNHEMSIRKMESEIAGLETNVQKTKQQSALIKKNTEYQTMLSTIAMCQEQISRLESSVLEAMDKVEAGQAELRKITSACQIEIKSLKSEWMELDTLEKDIKAEQSRLAAERTRLHDTLPSGLAAEYDNLYKANDGAPLVMIQENGICGHCFLKITPQTLNRALTGAVICCDNCRHLIYDQDAK